MARAKSKDFYTGTTQKGNKFSFKKDKKYSFTSSSCSRYIRDDSGLEIEFKDEEFDKYFILETK